MGETPWYGNPSAGRYAHDHASARGGDVAARISRADLMLARHDIVARAEAIGEAIRVGNHIVSGPSGAGPGVATLSSSDRMLDHAAGLAATTGQYDSAGRTHGIVHAMRAGRV